VKGPKLIFWLVVVMATSALVVGGITLSIIYNASFNETRDRLSETAKSQAMLIQQTVHISKSPIPDTALFDIIKAAHVSYEAADFKAEIVFAKRVGETIQFLFRHRSQQLERPLPVPFTSKTAEPMRHALLGETGSVIALDYVDEKVLAAYAPINGGQYGVVAKMNLSDIRSPFIVASSISLLLWFAVVGIASFFSSRLIAPLIQYSDKQSMYLRSIIDNANSAIVVTNETGTIESFNPMAEKTFGYSAGELIGRNIKELTPPNIRVHHDNYMKRYIETRQPRVVGSSREVKGLRKDGTIVHLDFALGFIDSPTDKKFVGVLRDITVVKEKEAQLFKAVKTAQEASAAKSRFLANMSHEVRTPLNAINGYAEMMAMEIMGPIGNEKYAEYISDIHNSGKHLHSLIEDLLDMAKIEAGELQVNETNLDLYNLIHETVKLAKPRLDNKNITIEIAIDNPVTIRGDKRALKQIHTNLLSNAIKFTNEGGKIEIAIQKQDGIQISIKDNGIGVPKLYHDKIFDPFFHIAAPGTTKETGTGLGLSIVKELIQLHDGKISIDSVEGDGACFNISIPKERLISA